MLEKRFPNSPRVVLLLGLKFEAQGDVDKAKKVYDELLVKDETNVVRIGAAFIPLQALINASPGNI